MLLQSEVDLKKIKYLFKRKASFGIGLSHFENCTYSWKLHFNRYIKKYNYDMIGSGKAWYVGVWKPCWWNSSQRKWKFFIWNFKGSRYDGFPKYVKSCGMIVELNFFLSLTPKKNLNEWVVEFCFHIRK